MQLPCDLALTDTGVEARGLDQQRVPLIEKQGLRCAMTAPIIKQLSVGKCGSSMRLHVTLSPARRALCGARK